MVIALDKAEQAGKMRSILCLFEGVVTGAADGYARMTGKPALSLLHLGHGLANGLANLHNAKWARAPVINIVGDHASQLRRYFGHPTETQSSPYVSDIEGLAEPMSGWMRRSRHPDLLAADAWAACAASVDPIGQVATLIVPADVAWTAPTTELHSTHHPPPFPRSQPPVSEAAVASTAALLETEGERCLLLVGGDALLHEGLEAANRLALHSGASLASNNKVNAA